MSGGESNQEESNDGLDRLVEILTKPEKRILPLMYSNGTSKPTEDGEDNGWNKESYREKNNTLTELLNISKYLFADIESLGKQYQKLHEKLSSLPEKGEDKTMEDSMISGTILSGLLELHVPPEVEPTDGDLPETLFGQVDLQTAALAKLVKKSTKRLSKADKNGGSICVLDMGVVDSDVIDDGNSTDEHDASEDDNNNDQNEGKEYDEDEDEVEKRIRLRMERAMHDMEENSGASDSEEENAEEDAKKEKTIQKKEEDLYDPVAEDLKDGFFDLNEMEDFADEEEDYLPIEALGHPADEEGKNRKTTTNTKSFHQRQREGLNEDSDSEDSDDMDMDVMYEDVKDVKRKKYREKEDIDALYDLYQETNAEDSDDDDDVVDMTAADFFGGPKKKYIERYNKNHPPAKKSTSLEGNDDDSWGEYDFEKEAQEEWRDDHDDGDDEDSDSEGDDEIEDMKEPSTAGVKNEDSDNKKLTKEEEKLRQQTDELERELVDEKPWQMRGETKSTSRPVNSLLEGTPEFEMASKQAQTITVEHTIDLEEAIKKRILSEDWDDVVPRELPDIGWNKKRGEAPEVSQEKSKLGLGELYEREYLKKAVGFDKDAVEKQTEEDKAKEEMKQLFANLCSKLDALSNYHFAPRPIADEAEARPVTVPAIAMEEVLPLHVSNARGVAPEEVFATKRGREGILRGDTEMDQNERKRLRQSKKAIRRKARKEKEADEKLISRLQPGLGLNNPYEKRKAREELSLARARGKVTTGEKDMDNIKFGSSATFFKRLQAEAQQTISNNASNSFGNDREKKSKPRSSAFKL